LFCVDHLFNFWSSHHVLFWCNFPAQCQRIRNNTLKESK
jgi:hypothetical protein